MTRQRVLLVLKNLKYKNTFARLKKGEWKLPKRFQETPINFSPSMIIEEDKAIWKFWRNPKRILIHIQGNKEAIAWNRSKEGKVEPDMGFLDLDTILRAVKTVIIRAISEMKTMSKTQFYLIMALNVILLVVVFYGFNRMGAFR
jgi:hypothetical protein